MQHRVMGDLIVELGFLAWGRQFAIEQQIADLKKITVFGKLLDGVAAMEQDTVVTVDIGNGGFAAAGRHKSRIIGEIAGVRV